MLIFVVHISNRLSVKSCHETRGKDKNQSAITVITDYSEKVKGSDAVTPQLLLPFLRKGVEQVGNHLPEINYIAFTGTSLAGDYLSKVSLSPHLKGHISASQLNSIGLAWNYLDAACSLMAVGELLVQTVTNEVNDHQKNINMGKIIALTGSSVALASMTACGLGSWGFAVATMVDFGIAAHDMYHHYQMQHSDRYWIKEQLSELKLLQEKKLSTRNKATKVMIDEQINTIKDMLAMRLGEGKGEFNQRLTLFTELHEHVFINKKEKKDPAGKALCYELLKRYLTIKADKKRHTTIKQKMESQLKDNLKKSLITLAIKTASMIGMTLIAVGSSVLVCHPIGLAITIAVAIGYMGYMGYQHGPDAIKKIANFFAKNNKASTNMKGEDCSVKENVKKEKMRHNIDFIEQKTRKDITVKSPGQRTQSFWIKA